MPDPVETSRILNLLRGGARGLTADVMGAPVDLATDVTNLGIAGYGYGAHKLGLIDTPPDLLEKKNVPFSSDWLAKGTPLEEKEGEGGGYDAARLATALATALSGKVGRLPTKDTAPVRGSPASQAGAIYLDQAGKEWGHDLAVTHATRGLRGGHRGIHSFADDVVKGDAAMAEIVDDIKPFPPAKNELSNVSFAATNEANAGNLQDTGYGRNIIIPHPHAFDPKRTNTAIYPHDAGTVTGMTDMSRPKADIIRERLQERLDPGMYSSGWIENKHYKDIPEWLRSKDADRMRMEQDNYATSTRNNDLQKKQNWLVEGLRLKQKGSDKEIYPGGHVRQLMDPENWSNYESKYGEMTPKQIDFYVKTLRDYQKAKQKEPELYHEIKRYGTMPLNKENVLSYIADDQAELDFAKQYLKPRGVEVIPANAFSDPMDMHGYARDVQTRALRRGR